MQMIEGDHNTIDRLYARIHSDTRHTNINILLHEKQIKQRHFESWSLKLSSSTPLDQKIHHFLDNKLDALLDNPKQGLNQLKIFYQPSVVRQRIKTNQINENNYQDFEYRLRHLPNIHDHNQETASQDLLDVYAILINNWASSDKISMQLPLADNVIKKIILNLCTNENIDIRRLLASQKAPIASQHQQKSNFYSQLRNLFRRYM